MLERTMLWASWAPMTHEPVYVVPIRAGYFPTFCRALDIGNSFLGEDPVLRGLRQILVHDLRKIMAAEDVG